MIPLFVLLIPYGLFLLIFLFFALVNLFHLLRFSPLNLLTFFATFLFLAGTTLILTTSYNYLITINWSQVIDLLPNFSAPTYAP